MRTRHTLQICTPSSIQNYTIHLIGASLSEPHTSGTALQDACVYLCMSACLLVAIY